MANYTRSQVDRLMLRRLFFPQDTLLKAYGLVLMPDGGFYAQSFFIGDLQDPRSSCIMQALDSLSRVSLSPSRENGSECFYRGGLTNESTMSLLSDSRPPMISYQYASRMICKSYYINSARLSASL